MRAVLGLLCWSLSKLIRQCTQLLGERHHQLWVAINLVDKFREHGNELFDTPFRSKQACNLAKPLNRVHLGVWILTTKIIDE